MLIRRDRLVWKVSTDGKRVCATSLFTRVPGTWFHVGDKTYVGCWFDIKKGARFTGVRLDPVDPAPEGQASLKLRAGAFYGVRISSTGRVEVVRIRPEEVRRLKCEQILEIAGLPHETIMVRTDLAGVSAIAYDACTTDGERRTDQTIHGGTFALFGKRVGASEKFTPAAAIITGETEPSDLLLTLAASGNHWSVPALREELARPVAATR